MGALEGKVAFITGAARGQGRAEAIRLAEEGADIVALDICGPIVTRELVPASTAEDLAETVAAVEALDRRILARQADTRDFRAVQGVVDAGLAEFGHIDIAVANAATPGAGKRSEEISEEEWKATLDINLTGVWHTVKAVLPSMIAAGQGGSIITISSGAALKPTQHLTDYGAAKAAVIYLTKALALENGQYGIRVNTIAPGSVDTPMVMNDKIFALFRPDLDKPTRADVEPVFVAMNALKTKPWLAPQDIANAVAWLASDEAAFITGIVLPVDMGGTIS